MKEIKVFLASSKEMEQDRNAISNLFRSLNDHYVNQGLYIRLFMCNEEDGSVKRRKQDEYNEFIKSSDFFICLFWHKAGEFTVEEFDTAYKQYLCSLSDPKKPVIYVYMREVSQDEEEESLKHFRNRIETKIEHFHGKYNHIDTLKFNILLQWVKFNPELRDDQIVVDGNLSVLTIKNGPSLMPMSSLPFVSNNIEYQELCINIEEQRKLLQKYPEEKYFIEKLNSLLERKHKMDCSLLDTAKWINQLSLTSSSDRLNRAVILFQSGDNNGANALLSEVEKELDNNKDLILKGIELVENATLALTKNVDECILRINFLLNSQGTGWPEEVNRLYEKVLDVQNLLALSKQKQILFGYINFCINQGFSQKALRVVQRATLMKELSERDNLKLCQYSLIVDSTLAGAEDNSIFFKEYEKAGNLFQTLIDNKDVLLDDAYSYVSCSIAMEEICAASMQYEMSILCLEKAINIYMRYVDNREDSFMIAFLQLKKNYRRWLTEASNNKEIFIILQQLFDVLKNNEKKDEYMDYYMIACRIIITVHIFENSIGDDLKYQAKELSTYLCDYCNEKFLVNPRYYLTHKYHALLLLGMCDYQLGNFTQAQDVFENIDFDSLMKNSIDGNNTLQTNSIICLAYYFLSCIYNKQCNRDASIKCYENIRNIYKKDAIKLIEDIYNQSLEQAGFYYSYLKNDNNKAIGFYMELYERFMCLPHHIQIQHLDWLDSTSLFIARKLLGERKYKDAEKVLMDAMKIWQRSDLEETASALTARFQIAIYKRNIGRIYELVGEENCAQDYLNEANCIMNECLISSNNYSSVDYVYRLNQFAYSLIGNEEYLEALKLIDEAISLNPEDVNLYDTKGEILYKMGDKDASRKMLTIVKELDPELTFAKQNDSVLPYFLQQEQ